MSESAITTTETAERLYEKVEELKKDINENAKFMYSTSATGATDGFIAGKNVNINENIDLYEKYRDMSMEDLIICHQGLNGKE